jgi:hypothetical protein
MSGGPGVHVALRRLYKKWCEGQLVPVSGAATAAGVERLQVWLPYP